MGSYTINSPTTTAITDFASGTTVDVAAGGVMNITGAAIQLNGGGTSTLLEAGGSITASGDGIDAGAGARIVIDGDIAAGGTGILTHPSLIGVPPHIFTVAGASVTIHAGTHVSGVNGVEMAGGNNSLTNNGDISGSSEAVILAAANTGGQAYFGNTGTIEGNILFGEAGGLTNSGSITGDIKFSNVVSNNLTNSGTITGNVAFGSASDTLDINGGHISGIVDMGAGIDTAFWHGNAGNYHIGFDATHQDFVVTDKRSGSPDGTVKVANVETLQFADKSVQTLVSTTSGAALVGGSGENIFVGEASNTMTGGAARDTFVFQKGFGNDTITNFQVTGPNHDVIDLSHSGFGCLEQLLEHHAITQQGSNVVIAFDATDSLTLDNVKLSTLLHHDDLFHMA